MQPDARSRRAGARSQAAWALDRLQPNGGRASAILQTHGGYSLYRTYFEESPPEVAANTAICLVCQATYLLDRLKKSLEQTFLEHGGIAERMLQARLTHRGMTGL